MNRAVIADEDSNDAHHANERGKTNIRPSGCSRERQNRVLDVAPRRHDPERDDYGEDASKMKNEKDAFDHG